MRSAKLLHAAQCCKKVQMPVTAAELAVRDRAQPNLLLLCDEVTDCRILRCTQFLCACISCGVCLTHLHECGGAQKAPHNVITKWCFCFLYGSLSFPPDVRLKQCHYTTDIYIYASNKNGTEKAVCSSTNCFFYDTGVRFWRQDRVP